MDEQQIRFDDGAAYEDFMGKWSWLAGEQFLQWLAPVPGRRWLDVGCGNGAFTELLLQRCAPSAVEGLDPSEEQLLYARGRLAGQPVQLQQGNAMALPFADAAFDAAVMALVIFFVPEPARGVAEMARVVKPGGSVSAYAWDILGGGFPFAVLQEEMAALGVPPLWPPRADASRMDAMRTLWTEAGLVSVETMQIQVQRSFDDFDSFWRVAQSGPRLAPRLTTMMPADVERLTARLHERLRPDADGRIRCSATANAIRGLRPAA
ncbi:MAG TPA: class I SAM-dependent methyltransferase [Ideonella sp.]|uniref:class I SAM-dependent methyltransferase n=1 Tax=Ideonella sp. TaxID=1929293 RepID=UPI002B8FF7B7|nr:class I SAM-dependent methyltransferase [Ideonella sp.]HSI48878.1 class I SAM-dependent methyltransferase [Ideonella sp.]